MWIATHNQIVHLKVYILKTDLEWTPLKKARLTQTKAWALPGQNTAHVQVGVYSRCKRQRHEGERPGRCLRACDSVLSLNLNTKVHYCSKYFHAYWLRSWLAIFKSLFFMSIFNWTIVAVQHYLSYRRTIVIHKF